MRDNPRMSHRLPEPRQALDDADLRGPLDRGRSPTSSTAATSPRGRPGSRSRSTCRPRPATTPTTSWRAARSARSACRSAHKGDMHALLDGIPLDRMNTSMTINATAAWLLALYIVAAEENGVDAAVLQGTTQNDIIKEYLSRGTYAFPPAPVDAADRRHGRLHGRARAEVEPGQHLLLPPAGGGRDAGAGDRLRDVDRDRGARRGAPARRRGADGRGLRPHLVLRQRRRALRRGAREAARDGRAVGGARPRALRRAATRAQLRFRYGVQVNSLGLTESQPENNVQRIVLEALAVTLGRNARARAIQLPAWNEALGLPRPWDQQWSLRIQQVLAYETDLLEYPDLFEGSKVMDGPRRRAARGRARGDGARRGARRRRRGGART